MTANTEHPPGFSENGQWAWSASLLKTWLECPRKYQLKIVEGWQECRPHDHFKFGRHIAEALSCYHHMRAGGASLDDARAAVVRKLMVDTWGWESMTRGKTREALVRTLIWYLDHWPEEMLQVARVSGKVASELHFRVPLANEAGDDIIWFGFFDQILDLPNGVYVVDQKTTSLALSNRWLEGWDLDLQMTGYAFVAKIGFGLAIAGVIVDGMQTGQGFTRFARTVTTRSDETIDEWLAATQHHIRAARQAYRDNYFPMNTTACGNYGGCEYRHVCGASPRLRDSALRADFEVKRAPDAFSHPE